MIPGDIQTTILTQQLSVFTIDAGFILTHSSYAWLNIQLQPEILHPEQCMINFGNSHSRAFKQTAARVFSLGIR